MDKAIIYCRVATVEQNQPFADSIKTQLLACVKFAQRNGYEIKDVVCEQGSGITINEQLKEVLKQVESGNIKAIITYDVERISRNCATMVNTSNEVEANGGEIRYANGTDVRELAKMGKIAQSE